MKKKKKKKKKVKITDFIFQRDFARYLIRHWLSELSSTQALVLLMIADRTIQWGKEYEAIPVRHFTDGITSKGELVHAGLGVRDKAIRLAVQELEERKMIIVIHRTNGRANRYAINLEWKPKHLNKNLIMSLPRPENQG